jgi:hypothetical protein
MVIFSGLFPFVLFPGTARSLTPSRQGHTCAARQCRWVQGRCVYFVLKNLFPLEAVESFFWKNS